MRLLFLSLSLLAIESTEIDGPVDLDLRAADANCRAPVLLSAGRPKVPAKPAEVNPAEAAQPHRLITVVGLACF